jgi:hypothetical protein
MATTPLCAATLFADAPNPATEIVASLAGAAGFLRSSTSTVPSAPFTTKRRRLTRSKAVISAAPGAPPSKDPIFRSEMAFGVGSDALARD